MITDNKMKLSLKQEKYLCMLNRLDALSLIKEIKHADTVFESWLNTESMIVANRVIESNTKRFSDEKVANKNLE